MKTQAVAPEPAEGSESIWEAPHPPLLCLLTLGHSLLATVRDETDWLNAPSVKTSMMF